VPDEPYLAHLRLDSTNFLHDLTKAIDDAIGTNPSVLPPRRDLSALRKRFGKQLLWLEEESRSTGCKTIIVVDGLDHAQRPGALDIDRTFLSVLPEPHQIPYGVLLIVGTQHLRLDLPAGILRQLNENSRRVEMDSLSPGQVERIVERAGVGPLLAQDRTPYRYRQIVARIVSLCDGHPLFVCALISRLRQAIAGGQSVEAIVEQTPAYVGSIYDHYDYLWTQIEEGHRPRLREFVGQIARLHPDIDLHWVRSWDDLREEEREFGRYFKHLFVRVPPDRWRFFHNSFRLFLIDRSLETIDGADPVEDARYHRRLAERCSTAPDDSEHQWSLVYHLARGGDDERLFDAATGACQ
jgi:hypothetical protein